MLQAPCGQFRWTDEFVSNTECRACREVRERRSFLVIEEQVWFRCAICDSVFVSPFSYPDYEVDYEFQSFTKYYCEMGAGLEFVTAPLEAVRAVGRGATFLDAGCGYGFTVHYAREVLGWEAIGVDPAPYARDGARELAITIDDQLLGGGSIADRREFDVIMASEVIEHLLDPLAFLSLVRRHLRKEGICIFTTPDSAALRRDASYSQVLASTFPGFHSLNFSAQGLHHTLETAGFAAIRIIQVSGRIIAYASTSPRGLDRLDPMAVMRPEYFGILQRIGGEDVAHVRIGAAYRRFRLAVSSADHEAAARLLDELAALVGDRYRMSRLDPVMLRARGRVGGPAAFGTDVPFMAAPMAYFAGVAAQQRGLSDQAERWFGAAIELTEILMGSPTSSCLWVEAFDLYREAQLAHAATLLALGHNDAAIARLQTIESGGDGSLRDRLAPISASVTSRAAQQLGVAYARIGQQMTARDFLLSSKATADRAGLDAVSAQSADLMKALALA